MHLKSTPYHLIRIRDRASNYLRGTTESQCSSITHTFPIRSSSLVVARSVSSPDILEWLIDGELHCAVTYAQQADAYPSVEAFDALIFP